MISVLYRRTATLFLVCALVLACNCGQHAWAQVAPSSDAPPVSTAPPPSEDEEKPEETIRVNVNLVSLYFTVTDKQHALVPNLTRDQCMVTEDKQQQKIKNFAAEADQPLTLGILLDTSGSQQYVLPLEQQAGGAFLKRVLKPKDEAFLVSFDTDVNLLSDYSSVPRDLEKALNKAEISTGGGGLGPGPVPTSGSPRGTLLYDAVQLASGEKLRQETGRKALILLTDGMDQGSRTKPNEAIEAAQKANAIVYVILIADRQFYGNGYGMGGGYGLGYSGDGAMKKLAQETGGRVINVGNNGKKLEDAFQQIENELRTQYVLSYTPTNTKLDGSFREIDIACKGDGLKIQARRGYYALPPEE